MAMGALAVGCVVVTVAVGCLVLLGDREPLYSAAIDSASGLDDPAHLNPVFNLTLRIRTRSLFSRGCAAPGSALEVSYAGAVLARGHVPRFCARRRGGVRERRVVAWGQREGAAAALPGFAVDALAADVRNGVRPAFDVAVWMPAEPMHTGTLVTCGGRRVGDASALGDTCGASDSVVVMTLSAGDHHD